VTGAKLDQTFFADSMLLPEVSGAQLGVTCGANERRAGLDLPCQ
jgi:hypothetical protein